MIAEIDVRDSIQEMIGMMDALMLATNGGGERTVLEWKGLLAKSGFRFTQLKRTRAPFSLVVAEPL